MNLLEQRTTENQYILGTMLSEITTPNIVRMLAAGGFEYVIIDCEHGYFDFSQTAAIIGVANGINLPVIIRVPSNSRGEITKYMDMGADGILLPMSNTALDIQAAVSWAKYSPIGRRGISTQRAHTEYNPPNLKDYLAQANARTMVFAQIETREGIRNISEIAKVEGVDGLIVGPNDLASDFGTPGNFDTAEMNSGISKVIAAAKAVGKPSGIISGDIPFLKSMREQGMTIFSCSSEVSLMITGAKKTVADMK